MAQSLLQWNCRSIYNKKTELIYLINKHNPFLLAIQETWLKPNSIFRVHGFTCLRDDRTDGYGGVAILVARSVIFSHIPIPAHSDFISAVAVRVNNTSFLSIYIPDPHSGMIAELFAIISSIPPPIVILGDFNVHHTSWGSHSCDSVSSAFLDLFDNLNLCVLNDGSPTRRVQPSQNPKSAVDLSLCSPSISSRVFWQVIPSSLGSDHFPIKVSFPDPVPSFYPPPRLKYRSKKADWPKFRSCLDEEISLLPPPDSNNLLLVCEAFKNAVLSAADKSIPRKKKPSKKIPLPPWWDAECLSAVKKRREAESVLSNNLSRENYQDYLRVAEETSKFLQNKKKIGWQQFCERLSPNSPPSLVWEGIRRFRGAFAPKSNMSSDPSEWIESFALKLAPPSAPNVEEISPVWPPSYSLTASHFNAPFTMEEFHAATDHLQDSSPGVDGIPYSFIVNSSTNAKQLFLNIINNIFLSGSPPEEWKSQIIVPILKPGKLCNDPSSYRPIALSSALAKILEHLIKNRLEWLAESKGLLAKSQFGFRKSLGTMDSLAIFTTDIRLAFSKGKSVVGVFLDISSAYDNVLLPLLRQKLHHLSFPERLVDFTVNFLLARSVLITSNNISLPPRLIYKGLPQGSVLSPLLYSLYTYDLELSVNSFCNILQYADDICLYSTVSDIPDATTPLSSAIHYLNIWLTEHGLSLSVPKCAVVPFTRKRFVPDIPIYCDGTRIPVQSKIKFLGVLLDSKMTGVHQINQTIKKCERNLNIIRSLSGVWWGSHPYTQKLVYNALIRSLFDYGSFLIEPCSKSYLNSLDKIQYKSLRLVIGAMKSSPTNALQLECADPPLSIRRQFLSDKYVTKIIQCSSHPLVSKLRSLAELITTSPYWSHKDPPCLVKSYLKISRLPCPISQCRLPCPLFEAPYDAIMFRPNISLDLCINRVSPNLDLNRVIDRDWPNWTSIYTDASQLSKQGCVGSSVWIPKFKIILSYKLPIYSSVFTGEAVAIFEALNLAIFRLQKRLTIHFS